MKYFLRGKEVTKEEFAAAGSQGDDWLQSQAFVPNTYRQHDPLISEGIGCLKSQVPEMRETIKQHNIKGVTVQDSGRLEITSRQGRRELLRVRGRIDADGGYGD